MFDINIHRVKKSDGTAITDLLVSSQDIFVTECLVDNNNPGQSAIEITENKSGGLGSVEISRQYSKDKINWYPYYSLQNGVLTIDPDITIGNSFKKIQLPFRTSYYKRFQVLALTDSKITLDYISQTFS